jgi:ankyrin repeat protein
MFAGTAKAGDTHVQASTELFNAAFGNDLAGVKKGVDDGGDVNTVDLKGVSPLLLAVHNSNVEMVKFLLSKKANVNASSTNSSPVHEAVRQHSQQLLDIILSAGGNINLTTDFGKTPLHMAIQEEQEGLIDYLISKKADVKAKNDGLVGCLHFGAATSNHKLLEKLLKFKELNANERNGNGKTPLHVAAEKNNIDHIKILLNLGVDSKIKDGWGRLAEECGKTTAYHLIHDHKPGTKYDIIDPNAPDPKKPEKLFDTGDLQI